MSFERYIIPILLDQRNYDYFKDIYINYNLTLDIIEKHPEIRWKGDCLSENPNITWDFIERHPDFEWFYGCIDDYAYYDYNDYNNENNYHFNCPFRDRGGLSIHPNINFDIIFAHPEKPWQNHWLNFNPNLTWDIVVEHPEINWNLNYLFHNPILNRKPDECNEYALK